jgi:hypothetical protein
MQTSLAKQGLIFHKTLTFNNSAVKKLKYNFYVYYYYYYLFYLFLVAQELTSGLGRFGVTDYRLHTIRHTQAL